MNKKGFSKVVKGALLGLADKCEKALMSPRFGATLMMLCMVSFVFAQNAAGDIAGVVAVVGAISVYIKMNNEEQDVKKSIMMLVGACIFLIAAAQALPLFFGISE